MLLWSVETPHLSLEMFRICSRPVRKTVHSGYVPSWISVPIHFRVGPECTADVYYWCNTFMACIFFYQSSRAYGSEKSCPRFYSSFSDSLTRSMRGTKQTFLYMKIFFPCPISALIWSLVWPAAERLLFCSLLRLTARVQTYSAGACFLLKASALFRLAKQWGFTWLVLVKDEQAPFATGFSATSPPLAGA